MHTIELGDLRAQEIKCFRQEQRLLVDEMMPQAQYRLCGLGEAQLW